MTAQDRQQTPRTHFRLLPARDQTCQVRTMFEEPFQVIFKARDFIKQRWLNRCHCKKRDQSHHGTNLEGNIFTMLQMKNIVKEFVFFVPERDAFACDIVHGFRNEQEMLKEFQSDIFVSRIMTSHFQGNGKHIETEHSHPARAVTLFNVTSGWERSAAVEHADVIQAQKAALKDI